MSMDLLPFRSSPAIWIASPFIVFAIYIACLVVPVVLREVVVEVNRGPPYSQRVRLRVGSTVHGYPTQTLTGRVVLAQVPGSPGRIADSAFDRVDLRRAQAR